MIQNKISLACIKSQFSLLLRVVLVLLCVGVFCPEFVVKAQEHPRVHRFPIWTYHDHDVVVDGVSIGLVTLDDSPRLITTNGIKVEIMGIGFLLPLMPRSPIADSDSAFLKLAANPLSERINGIAVSTTGSVCHCVTNGITAGGIGQINYQVNGLAVSMLMNFVQQSNGLMISAFNEAYNMNGLQVGLASGAAHGRGAMLSALFNGAVSHKGVQLGLFNAAATLKGVQIGLWNVNQHRKLPLINWSFDRVNTAHSTPGESAR